VITGVGIECVEVRDTVKYPVISSILLIPQQPRIILPIMSTRPKLRKHDQSGPCIFSEVFEFCIFKINGILMVQTRVNINSCV
jgi:hypothetical protein